MDVRRSISELLGTMDQRQRLRWFELNELEPSSNLAELIESALDDGIDEGNVLASLVEAMTESDDA
jgi:hypothetical protein